MMIRIAVLSLFLSSFVSFASANDVTVQKDKFTGETTISLKAMGVGTAWDTDRKMIQLLIAASHSSKDGKIMLAVVAYASSYQFLNGTDVLALVDGERIDLGHFAPGQATISTSPVVMTSEIVAGYVDRAMLAKLANAKTLEIKVGSFEIKLAAKHVKKLKEFASAIPAETIVSK